MKLIALPSTARAASPSASDSVGCGWTAEPTSHAVASSSIAALASVIRSVTCGADHVDAQQLVGLLVGDDLDEALVLAADERLADGLERDLADLDREAVALALGLLRPIDAICGRQ